MQKLESMSHNNNSPNPLPPPSAPTPPVFPPPSHPSTPQDPLPPIWTQPTTWPDPPTPFPPPATHPQNLLPTTALGAPSCSMTPPSPPPQHPLPLGSLPLVLYEPRTHTTTNLSTPMTPPPTIVGASSSSTPAAGHGAQPQIVTDKPPATDASEDSTAFGPPAPPPGPATLTWAGTHWVPVTQPSGQPASSPTYLWTGHTDYNIQGPSLQPGLHTWVGPSPTQPQLMILTWPNNIALGPHSLRASILHLGPPPSRALQQTQPTHISPTQPAFQRLGSIPPATTSPAPPLPG